MHGSPTAEHSRHEQCIHMKVLARCAAVHAWDHGPGVKLGVDTPTAVAAGIYVGKLHRQSRTAETQRVMQSMVSRDSCQESNPSVVGACQLHWGQVRGEGQR